MANEDLIHHNVQRQSEWIQADVPRVNVDAADPLNYDNLEVSLLMSLQGRAMTAVENIPAANLTPFAIWKKLEDEYDRKTVGSKVSLIMRIVRIRQSDNEDVTEYMNRAETIQRLLTGQGVNLPNEMMLAFFLLGTHERFANTRETIECKQGITYASARQMLKDKEERLKLHNSNIGGEDLHQAKE